MLPGDTHGRQDGVAEELPEWIKRGLNSRLPASDEANQWLFDTSIEWAPSLLQGLLELGLKCTEPLIGDRPFLSVVETKLEELVSCHTFCSRAVTAPDLLNHLNHLSAKCQVFLLLSTQAQPIGDVWRPGI